MFFSFFWGRTPRPSACKPVVPLAQPARLRCGARSSLGPAPASLRFGSLGLRAAPAPLRIACAACLFLLLQLLVPKALEAQYDPAAGQPGSLALAHNDSRFRFWISAVDLHRGPRDCANSNLGLASAGSEYSVLGSPLNGQTLSLGDGGQVVLEFGVDIYDGPGPDFAVFENAFNDNFLELAFVEVSSDRQHFVRFPSASLSDTSQEIGSFGLLNPEHLYNLAGKYRSGYGTPFDLAELADSAGIDIEHIRAIRLIDVGGCLSCPCASRDASGRLINDPYPTPFETGGFDLDALGIIHGQRSLNSQALSPEEAKGFYPNPAQRGQYIVGPTQNGEAQLLDMQSRSLWLQIQGGRLHIPQELSSGLYILRYQDAKGQWQMQKLILR